MVGRSAPLATAARRSRTSGARSIPLMCVLLLLLLLLLLSISIVGVGVSSSFTRDVDPRAVFFTGDDGGRP